jgi:hypothetical protein
MWAAQHTSVPPRTSAKNLDLHTLTLKAHTIEEPTTYPHPTEMWLGKHQRSQPSSSSDQYQYSVPSLSPQSSIAGHDDHEDDDISSQASESTAYSATHFTPSQQKAVLDRVHVHILSAERYEPSLDGVEVDVEAVEDIKSPFVNGLDDEPGPGVHDSSLVSFHHAGQEFGFLVDRPRNHMGIPDSPPLTARAVVNNNNGQTPAIQRIETTGPLAERLHSLLSQVTIIESQSPTIMAADYTALQHRISTLEAEKASLLERREALFSLRDEDVSNLIKIRALLAKERREHDAIRKLRDDDLQNVIELRNKLAQATWANQSRPFSASVPVSISHKRMEKAQSVSASVSPSQSNDLWQTAKTAALEQRVLELESANADLRDKLDKSGGQTQQAGKEMQIVPSAASNAGFDQQQQQQQQPGIAALAELGLRAMRERETHKTEIEDLKSDNLKLRQQVEKMKYQLETSQAVIECFSQMLKSH